MASSVAETVGVASPADIPVEVVYRLLGQDGGAAIYGQVWQAYYAAWGGVAASRAVRAESGSPASDSDISSVSPGSSVSARARRRRAWKMKRTADSGLGQPGELVKGWLSPSEVSVGGRLGASSPDGGSRVDTGPRGSCDTSSDTGSVSDDLAELRETYGYCYLSLIDDECQGKVAEKLGRSPTFESLLDLSEAQLKPISEWGGLVVTRTAKGVYHLGHGVGLPAKNALAAVAAKMGNKRGATLATVVGIGCSRVDIEKGPGLSDRMAGTERFYRPDLAYSKWISVLAGHDGDVFPADVVALLSKAAAMRTAEEKRRGKMLEALGDSVLSTSVALRCVREGRSAEEYQTARSVVTSNPSLSRLFAEKVPSGFVAFPSGVSAGTGKAGAYMLEAILGAIYQHYGQDAVDRACRELGVFDLHQW